VCEVGQTRKIEKGKKKKENVKIDQERKKESSEIETERKRRRQY
jgi:hypothetical protein